MILYSLIKYDNAPALEATWVEDGVVVRCHAYSNAQMDELRKDLGDDAVKYEKLISEIESTYVPPEPEPLYVPQSVSMRQARLALLGVDLLDEVEAAINNISDPVVRKAAKIEWEYAQAVDRNSSFTQLMSSMIGISSDQLDQLFINASTL